MLASLGDDVSVLASSSVFFSGESLDILDGDSDAGVGVSVGVTSVDIGGGVNRIILIFLPPVAICCISRNSIVLVSVIVIVLTKF
jgi:hypothetical protein